MIPPPAALSSITAVIVDDEVLAREAIHLRLRNEPDIEVVAEAADGADAVELLRRLKPDLVFLDVQMPVMDGFEVLDNQGSRGKDRRRARCRCPVRSGKKAPA